MKKLFSFVAARRRSIGSVLTVAVAGLIGLASTGCHKAPPPAPPVSPPIVKVVEPTKNKTITRTVGQPSFVEAYERTSVYPKMTAYIKKWNVDIGDKVKKGDVMASLFVPEWEEEWETKKAKVELDKQQVELAKKLVIVAKADVEAAKARVAETMAILDQFKADVERWKVQVDRLTEEVKRGVVDPQVLTEAERQLRATRASEASADASILKAKAELLSRKATVDQYEIAVFVAQATLKVADSDAKRLEALVGYLKLPAPFDGIIHVRNANTGDFVLPAQGDPTAMQRSPLQSSTGASPIFVVDRTDVVRIFVDIPEHDANYVQKGTEAEVQIKAFRDKWLKANVTRTAWALNVSSRTLRAEIDLENTGSKMLPGMYAYGKVIIRRPNVTALPMEATFSVGEKTFYWSWQDGKAVKTKIETGVNDGKWIEVTSRWDTKEMRWVEFTGKEKVIIANDPSVIAEDEAVTLESEAKVASAESGSHH